MGAESFWEINVYFIVWHNQEVNAMNEENIKRIESRLARAYKEGHYTEDLERMLETKPTLMQSISDKLHAIFN